MPPSDITLQSFKADQGQQRIPVLICGAGPVGLALAVELGSRGIACMLVERGDGTVDVPKMSQLSTRTMEFCRSWGIADEVKKAGWPEEHPGDFIYVTSMIGHELFRQKFTRYADRADLGYTPEGPRQCPQIFLIRFYFGAPGCCRLWSFATALSSTLLPRAPNAFTRTYVV